MYISRVALALQAIPPTATHSCMVRFVSLSFVNLHGLPGTLVER